MKIGIVTCAEFPNLTDQEKPLVPLFAEKGVQIDPLVWNDPSINWQAYDCLLLRSIWDYHLHADEFFSWLQQLDEKNIHTVNTMQVVHWNRHKFYLRELAQQGVTIIPTLFFEKGSTLDVQLIKTQGWSHAVIKPAVSANAHLTESFSVPDAENALAPFQSPAHRRDWIVQSFMPEIHSTGEISLIYFNKQYSHAVLKTPAQGDFRVQADYGGSATAYQPSQKLIEAGAEILARVPQTLLYARVDGVVRNNQLFLMELELIEPELFFHLAPCSRERFVTATIDILNSTALR